MFALGACQPSSDYRARAPTRDTQAAAEPAFRTWFTRPAVEPDLDEAQALAQAARVVLQSLPEEQQRRILARWLPSTSAPVAVPSGHTAPVNMPGPIAPVAVPASHIAPVSVPAGPIAPVAVPASPVALVRVPAGPTVSQEGAPTPVASRLEVDLLAVMRGLRAQHGTRVLALTAFFLGSDTVTRATRRLRLAPERIGVGALARVLKRREQPFLRHVREAERWTTLYALAWPVDRSLRVTSRFGPRIHPLLGGLSDHRGVDVATPIGTEIRAPADGRVTRVRESIINGLWLELDHGTGVRTQFCHLSLADLKRGQQVKAGDFVARSGDTGRVTGPHLHYQVKVSGAWVDPLASRASAELVAQPFQFMPAPLVARTERPAVASKAQAGASSAP